MRTISWASGLGSNVPLDQFTDDEVFQFYANACATALCIGHQKGHMNELLAETYKAELIDRGLIPIENASKQGIFNGKGTY